MAEFFSRFSRMKNEKKAEQHQLGEHKLAPPLSKSKRKEKHINNHHRTTKPRLHHNPQITENPT